MRSLIIITSKRNVKTMKKKSLINFAPDENTMFTYILHIYTWALQTLSLSLFLSAPLLKRFLYFARECIFFVFSSPKETQTKPTKWNETFKERLSWEAQMFELNDFRLSFHQMNFISFEFSVFSAFLFRFDYLLFFFRYWLNMQTRLDRF